MVQVLGNDMVVTCSILYLPSSGFHKLGPPNFMSARVSSVAFGGPDADLSIRKKFSAHSISSTKATKLSKNLQTNVLPWPPKIAINGGRFSLPRVLASTTENVEGKELYVEADELGSDFEALESGLVAENKKLEFLANGYGWRVRFVEKLKEELDEVADIQAAAFHESSPILDKLLYSFFKAEILSGIYSNIRNAPPNRYACLVAEADCHSTGIGLIEGSENKILGVVEATADRRRSVLCHLEDAQEYLYVHSMAVRQSYRRKKIATMLLKACDSLAVQWGFGYVALQAYEDDIGAKTLYTNAGYRIASSDPVWRTVLLGKRPRVLMIKKVFFSSGTISSSDTSVRICY